MESVSRQTGLPVAVVEQIYEPIRKEKEAAAAVASAERSMWQAENRILREQRPCPLCRTGHAESFDSDVYIASGVRKKNGKRGGFWCHPYYCECSNRRCIARNLYPSDSEVEALERFLAGDFLHKNDFIDSQDGTRYGYTKYGDEQLLVDLLREWSPEQVKRLGADPQLVDTLALQRTLDRMGSKSVDVFDTTLLCPKCGMRGEYRKAVNPQTHAKTWWRVGCPHCKTRTRNAFPYKKWAGQAFETGDLNRTIEWYKQSADAHN
ncbi:hypothetical protein DF196_06515 [Bifidobacterium callitrichidarum]|uniref:Uncharacterized protein n=1 Tax=Bifidobacterium callitrichidarum TaxID=2052941 RepID=A0A2U2N962_9BIFI|nr:hypothetical protein DF196_06515 [Bifidobacterium callitrichidarum]